MKRFLSFLVTFVMLTLSAQPFVAQTNFQNPLPQTRTTRFLRVKNHVAGQYIILLRDNTPRSEVSSLATTLARLHGGTVEYIYTDIFKGFSVMNMSERQAQKLS